MPGLHRHNLVIYTGVCNQCLYIIVRRADIDNIVLERATALKKCFVDNEVITDHMNMATKNCQVLLIIHSVPL